MILPCFARRSFARQLPCTGHPSFFLYFLGNVMHIKKQLDDATIGAGWRARPEAGQAWRLLSKGRGRGPLARASAFQGQASLPTCDRNEACLCPVTASGRFVRLGTASMRSEPGGPLPEYPFAELRHGILKVPAGFTLDYSSRFVDNKDRSMSCEHSKLSRLPGCKGASGLRLLMPTSWTSRSIPKGSTWQRCCVITS